MRFEFPFNLVGKSTIAFLTGQSWHVLKSQYTGGGSAEQGVWRCFADGLKLSLVLSVTQARLDLTIEYCRIGTNQKKQNILRK